MISKDSLLQLLKQWDETQKKINELIDDHENSQALDQIRDSYNRFLKINLPEGEDEQLLPVDKYLHSLEFDELKVLADLLNKEGEVYYELEEDEKSRIKYQQALEVYNFLNKEEKLFSFEREAKIDLIQERLKFLNEQS